MQDIAPMEMMIQETMLKKRNEDFVWGYFERTHREFLGEGCGCLGVMRQLKKTRMKLIKMI